MKITRVEAAALSSSIVAMGGRPTEAVDGDKRVLITKPYDISGAARYALAKNKRLLQPILRDIDDERADLALKMSAHQDGKDMVKDAHALRIEKSAIDKAFNAFLQEEVEFVGIQIDVVGLKLSENQLDPTVVEGLLPILTGTL